MRFEFEPSGQGRFTVYATTPLGRERVGEAVGRPCRWFGDRPSKPQVGPFKARLQAAERLATQMTHHESHQ